MSYDDPEVRPLLDLEGLKEWVPGRVEGYAQLGGRRRSVRHARRVRRATCMARCRSISTSLGFAEGGHLLVKRALREAAARRSGHRHGHRSGTGRRSARPGAARKAIVRLATGAGGDGRPRRHSSTAAPHGGRWADAERVGAGDARCDAVAEHPPRRWGLAARGALVEAGTPEFDFLWSTRSRSGPTRPRGSTRRPPPRSGIRRPRSRGTRPFDLPDEVEDAVVQVMTYLIENETAALIVPSRFLAQLHPHFREVMQLLAVQAADEARHIEVFTRRALLKRDELGLSTSAARRRSRRWSTSRTSRSRPSCSRCSARAASCRCCGSSSGTRPDPVTARSPGSPRRTRRATSRSASRISASI